MAVLRVLVTALNVLSSACFISGFSLTALTLFSSYSRENGIATFALWTWQFNIIEKRSAGGSEHGLSTLEDNPTRAAAQALGIPERISFGTERICLDLEERRTCHLLSENITALFPAAVTRARGVGARMDKLWRVVRIVDMLSCTIASLAFLCTFGMMLCILPLLERPPAPPLGYQIIVRVVLTLVLSIPMLVSLISVQVVQAEIFRIDFLIGQSGSLRYYSLGGLCSSLFMGTLSLAAVFVRGQSRAVTSHAEPRSFFDKS